MCRGLIIIRLLLGGICLGGDEGGSMEIYFCLFFFVCFGYICVGADESGTEQD